MEENVPPILARRWLGEGIEVLVNFGERLMPSWARKPMSP